MTIKPTLLSATLLAGVAMAAPAQAQSMLGRFLGQTTPQAVLRPDMAAKIRDLLTGRGIPSDVADASLSALATGLVSGTSTTSTMKGFAYAWSIAGGPLDSRNCRAVAGGWKRATSPKSELTENGPWCWSAEGWIPVKNQFDGELSPVQAQAPVQRPAPRPAPPVATAATPALPPTPPAAAAAVTIEDIDKPLLVILTSPLKAWPDMSAPTLGELPLATRVRATGIVHGPVPFFRIVDASGRTGYMLAGRLAPVPPLPPSAPDTRSYPVNDMGRPATAPTPSVPATAVQAPAHPSSPPVVVQAPTPVLPAPAVQAAPVQAAPPPVVVEASVPKPPAVVQAAPPPAPAIVQAAPAPAPVVTAAPPPVAPPAPPPKPKVKTDL